MSVKRYKPLDDMTELSAITPEWADHYELRPAFVLASDYDALQSQVDALRAVIARVHEAAASGLLDTSFLASMPPKNTVAHTILQILRQSPATGGKS